MNWNRAVRVTGFVGATVCGVCLAKTCVKSSGLLGTVSADTETRENETTVSKTQSQLRDLRLKQVHVYFRHGARTPLHLLPGVDQVEYSKDTMLRTPPHMDFNYKVLILPDLQPPEETSVMEKHYMKTPLKGGGYAGNLTTYGQEQMYTLGLRLRQNYMDVHRFIDSEYRPEDVFVQSTNIARTIASARCVLVGLFGKKNLNKNGPGVIGVYLIDNDILVPNRHVCPVLKKTFSRARDDFDGIPGMREDLELIKQVLSKNGQQSKNVLGPVVIPVSQTNDEVLFPNSHTCSVIRKANHASMIHFDNIPGIQEERKILEEALNYKGDSRLNFVFLRDDLIARTTHGFMVPEHIRPYMDMIERNATKIIFYAMCGQHDVERPVITRLGVGPALDLMLKGIHKFRAGKKTPKMFLYSCHDSTMVALLESMGLFDWKWPPFAADLRLELYEDSKGEHWVRVLYLDEAKTVRGCDGPVCRFADFEKSLKPYVIARGAEYDKICSSQILEQIAASLVQHEKGEVETPEMKETSEIPAGM